MNKFVLSACIFLASCVNPAFKEIEGASYDEVRAQKGTPVTIVTEKGYQMWTYRRGECSEIIFFNEKGKADDLHEFGSCPAEN